jgi:hypothetical protein
MKNTITRHKNNQTPIPHCQNTTIEHNKSYTVYKHPIFQNRKQKTNIPYYVFESLVMVLALDQFLSGKEILIDDAGWGDLLLGVVIGALKPPDRRYMERRIPVSSFQPPNFENKKYLDDAVKITDEIVEVMQPDRETSFKVCSGYVLSSIRRHLRERGFRVEEVEIVGELQEMVERSYVSWCVEVGVPPERLQDERRFWTLLEWVAERPDLRERLVKTGWRSWKRTWRGKVFKSLEKNAHS